MIRRACELFVSFSVAFLSGASISRAGARVFSQRCFLICPSILAGLAMLAGLHQSDGAATRAALLHAPPAGVNHAMVLSDGTIYTDNGNGVCCRLTPDIHSNYRNGTWTRIATMNNDRLFFTSVVLTNGNVFVAGG